MAPAAADVKGEASATPVSRPGAVVEGGDAAAKAGDAHAGDENEGGGGRDEAAAKENDGDAAEGGAGSKTLVRPKEAKADPLLIREYVHQLISPELDTACGALLGELARLQERAHLKDPVKAAMRKRYVCGLREVLRSLKTSKAKALIVAHNIEKIESENGLDEMMGQIMQLCEQKLEWVYDDDVKAAKQQLVPRETPVPLVFAYTRRQLSRALKRSAKTSCVAVLSHDGASDLFHDVIKQASHGRRRWQALTEAYPSERDSERRLLMRHAKGESQARAADILTLHAQTISIEEE